MFATIYTIGILLSGLLKEKWLFILRQILEKIEVYSADILREAFKYEFLANINRIGINLNGLLLALQLFYRSCVATIVIIDIFDNFLF